MKIILLDFKNKKFLSDIENIFFETSSIKNFSSLESKEKFKNKYLGHYLNHYIDSFFVAVEDDDVLGYICACPNTLKDPYFFDTFAYYKSMPKEMITKYPAHLHINLSSKAQGMGIGSRLIDSLVSKFREQSVRGIHIFTTDSSRNVSFYRKNLFCDELSVRFNSDKLHCMGKVITSL